MEIRFCDRCGIKLNNTPKLAMKFETLASETGKHHYETMSIEFKHLCIVCKQALERLAQEHFRVLPFEVPDKLSVQKREDD